MITNHSTNEDIEVLEETKRPTAPRQPAVVPESLIYEVLDGRPLYYQDYRDDRLMQLTTPPASRP